MITRVTETLKQFVSEKIPQKGTNILYQIFNGINACFEMLEYRLDINKRERNILTAQNISSLRNLAAHNGVEPTLRIPASGYLYLQINSKFFNRVGYPLFIKPYSVFTNKITKLDYQYISNKTLRIDTNNYFIPVVEGIIKNMQYVATSEYIQSIYIPETKIANKSININVNGIEFTEVNSFYDNIGLFDDKQFLVKFSSDNMNPIIIYIKGLNQDDSVTITYRLTNGELGNLETQQEFETESLIDNFGNTVVAEDDEITIVNSTGFNYGSNGTDENTLRSAIGFNHGIELLFDNMSYQNFLNKFSTILVQKIENVNKQINNIYVWRKKSTISENSTNLINQYKDIVNKQSYFLSVTEKQELDKILEEYEFAMSSHNLFNPIICKFAFQIEFDTTDLLSLHKENINNIIYTEFSNFLYNKHYQFNVEKIFDNYMYDNNIQFKYIIFNSIDEEKKLTEKTNIITDKIISHTNYLPILKGDFNISDSSFNAYELNFDINFVVK